VSVSAVVVLHAVNEAAAMATSKKLHNVLCRVDFAATWFKDERSLKFPCQKENNQPATVYRGNFLIHLFATREKVPSSNLIFSSSRSAKLQQGCAILLPERNIGFVS